MQLTINIKTEEYLIRTGRVNNSNSSLIVHFTSEYINKEVLIIPIFSDDLVQIQENKNDYLIHVFSLEMFHKVVKPQHKNRKSKNGRAYIPLKYAGLDLLIIPLNENFIYDE